MLDLIAPRVGIESARLRWGIVWFAALMAALWVEVRPAAVILAAVAAMGGWQAATASGTDRVLAAVVAGAVVLAAVVDQSLMGVVIVAAVGGSVLAVLLTKGGGQGIAARSGALVGSWLLMGLAGGSVVVAAQRELGAAVILLWAAAMYDAGAYLVGAGSRSRWFGPAAGALGAVAVVYTAVQLAVPPIEPENFWRFALLVALTLPLGPVVARLAVGSDGWAVRRLDSLIVTGPLWAWAIDSVVG